MITFGVIVALVVLLVAVSALLVDARRDRRNLLLDLGAERDRADLLDALASGYLAELATEVRPEDHVPCGRNVYLGYPEQQHALGILCTLPAGHDEDCAAVSGHPC
jgi:hypothetical protein